MLDFSLSEDHRMLRAAVGDMLKRFEPRREQIVRMIMEENRFPEDLWEAICELGIPGCTIPEAYGGNGMGLLSMAIATEEMARHGFGYVLLVLGAMDAACICRAASEEQKKAWLPDLASGKVKFCFAVTEPNAGSNTFRIETLARRDGSIYRLNGSKTFITGADVADKMLVVARTTSAVECKDQGLPKVFGLSLFLIDTRVPGLELHQIPTQGIEGMKQFTVFFNDVVVPADRLIGEPDQGAMILFNCLNPERILAAASALGISEHLIAKSVDYARERSIFGKNPIGAYQAIQHPLARLKIEAEAVRLLTYKAAWAFDQAQDPSDVGVTANMAKFLAAELAVNAADRAIQTHGGYGFSLEYGIIQYWTNVRLLKTAPISQELVLNFIGEHVLGMPRSF